MSSLPGDRAGDPSAYAHDTLALYKRLAVKVMRIFRWDLQLHFFWGFVLTLTGALWTPLYGAGLIATLIKEALDLWSKGAWEWDDVWCGIAGCAAALGFLRCL